VATLRISPVENRPLKDALAELVEESKASGISTEFKITGKTKPVESKSALALYRVVQEGLTNIRKHAGASHVDVELDFSHADNIRLMLRDDGAGAADTSGGFGLIGLRERVQLLMGILLSKPNLVMDFKLKLFCLAGRKQHHERTCPSGG